MHILSNALFDQLRTKEQLGYLVQGFQGRLAGVLHYQIAVQSSDADGAYLDHRVEAFLAWFRSVKLADLIKETSDFIEQTWSIYKVEHALRILIGWAHVHKYAHRDTDDGGSGLASLDLCVCQFDDPLDRTFST